MEHLVVADAAGRDIRAMLFTSYDFEVGDGENSFQIVVKRPEWETIPNKSRIYIPNTEFGGLFRDLDTNTAQGTISPGGLTWRGLMQYKIIQPPSGADYATDSGDLNAIIKARVESALPGLFYGVSTPAGATVSNYKYDRYCTLYAGLKKLLKSKGYRLNLEYQPDAGGVVVSAVPIVDWSQTIEFSSDMRINYAMSMEGDGVNHLICLGKGELRNRLVRHLYVDANGNIDTTQYYTGVDEVAAIYDYAGAEASDLVQSGTERLKEMMNANEFDINLDTSTEVAIGDIVGGRDYLSGMKMTAPITGKIVRWENGLQRIEYKLEDDVSVTIEEE